MVRKINNTARKDKPSIYELRQCMAYLGYLKHSDTYLFYQKYIKPKFSFQYAKRRISKYDRRLKNDRMV